MQPTLSIFKKFPPELLVLIIDQTSDLSTLDSWCEATISNLHLYRSAVRNRWRQVVIKDDDLVTDSTHSNGYANTDGRSLCQRTNERLVDRLSQIDARGNRIATHVRHLVLRFLFSSLPSMRLLHDMRHHQLVPMEDKLRISFVILAPHLIHVQSIKLDAVVPQSLLDLVLFHLSACLTSLNIRAQYRSGSVSFGIGSRSRAEYLQLEGLSCLSWLRTLKVRRLAHVEASGLARAIQCLSSLECLFVASKSAIDNPRDRRLDSSLGTLLAYMFTARYGLPTKLVSFTLVDDDFKRQGAPAFDPIPCIQSAPQLKHICVDVDNPSTIQEILRCLPSITVEVLSVPSGLRTVQNPGLGQLEECDYTQHIIRFIYGRAEPRKLSEIVLLAAWDAHTCLPTKINVACDGEYSISEVVLGTKEPEFYDYAKNYCLWKTIGWGDINTIRHTLYGYRFPDLFERWGRQVERLRIDSVNVEALDSEEIGYLPSKKSMRILMLCPQSFGSTAIRPEEPPSLESFPEGRFALAVAQSWFPSLRVLVLNGYRFWLAHSDPETQCSAAVQVWNFLEAQFDAVQSVALQQWITPRDQKFLSDVYPSGDGVDHGSEWEQSDVNQPSLTEFRLRNFMVMLPVAGVGQ
ncbi:hypothetical protein MMC26_003669 [Xylographa opegraphella]|nr:hypothetical protein [Xylographa opegraphella]